MQLDYTSVKYGCFLKFPTCLNWYSSHLGRNNEQLLSTHLVSSIHDIFPQSCIYFLSWRVQAFFFQILFMLLFFCLFWGFFWAPQYAFGAEKTWSYTQYSRQKHSPNNGFFPCNSCLSFVLLCWGSDTADKLSIVESGSVEHWTLFSQC